MTNKEYISEFIKRATKNPVFCAECEFSAAYMGLSIYEEEFENIMNEIINENIIEGYNISYTKPFFSFVLQSKIKFKRL